MGEKGVFKDQPEKRTLLGELLKLVPEDKAIKALDLGKTPTRTIAVWKKRGLYPYDTPDVVQVNDTVVQQSVFQNNDSVAPPVVQPVVDEMLLDKIEKLVNDAVESKIQSIQTELQSSSNVVKLRPILKKVKKDKPTSFRLPKILVERVKAQAKKDRTSINALVETFLFEYIGCPADLLEE